MRHTPPPPPQDVKLPEPDAKLSMEERDLVIGNTYRKLMEIESRLLPCGLHVVGCPPTAEEAIATLVNIGELDRADNTPPVKGLPGIFARAIGRDIEQVTHGGRRGQGQPPCRVLVCATWAWARARLLSSAVPRHLPPSSRPILLLCRALPHVPSRPAASPLPLPTRLMASRPFPPPPPPPAPPPPSCCNRSTAATTRACWPTWTCCSASRRPRAPACASLSRTAPASTAASAPTCLRSLPSSPASTSTPGSARCRCACAADVGTGSGLQRLTGAKLEGIRGRAGCRAYQAAPLANAALALMLGRGPTPDRVFDSVCTAHHH